MNETRELIKKAQQGDKKALEKLISENSGLIKSVAKRFLCRGLDKDDLFQLGAIGLIKCIKRFDLSYDVKLSTYAVPMIAGEIKRFLRDDGQIKVSRSLKELGAKTSALKDEFRKKFGREPSAEEAAERLGVSKEEIIMAVESSAELESLDASPDTGSGSVMPLKDRVMAKDERENIDNSIMLRQALQELGSRERSIIRMRYYEDKTQTEVAGIIGVSQVQISRLEKKILKTIRDKYFRN